MNSTHLAKTTRYSITTLQNKPSKEHFCKFVDNQHFLDIPTQQNPYTSAPHCIAERQTTVILQRSIIFSTRVLICRCPTWSLMCNMLQALCVLDCETVLGLQLVLSQSPAEKETQAVKHANKKEDEKVTSDEVKMDVNAELKDAAAKGLVKDAGENLDPSASPKQDEEFMLKLFMEALTKMADEGKMDPKVLKDKLFPGGSATIDPKVKPEVVKALKDAIAETQKVERGGA
ncbi:hypothetical protein V6N13_129397 [Hibiscus sabdariffa]